jgi:Na+-transporting NADH:ubiquinone oxidoreductase subunit NqrB
MQTITQTLPNKIINAYLPKIDARDFQILFLSTFLIFGLVALNWEFNSLKYIAIFSGTLLAQTLAIFIFKQEWNALKSALVTSLGLSILMQASAIEYYFIAGFIAITAKYIFRFNKTHFINPANFGLVICSLFSHQVWISPSQWGNFAWLLFLIGGLGFLINYKVKTTSIAISFFITFFLLSFSYSILYLHWPIDFLLHQFSNGGILLFTFFMITDPVSTPQHKYVKIIWAIGIAILSFYLIEFKFMPYGFFMALFLASFSTPFLNYFFPGQKFLWKK